MNGTIASQMLGLILGKPLRLIQMYQATESDMKVIYKTTTVKTREYY